MLRRLFRVLGPLAIWLVAADLLGVAACFFFDVMPLRSNSGALPFAIWFVLGAFSGVLTVMQAGAALHTGDERWLDHADAKRTCSFVLGVSAAVLAALCVLFYRLWWRYDVLGESFVPDSLPLTLTFFGALLGSITLVRAAVGPR